MKNSTYSRCPNTVSTVRKSQGHDAGGLATQERPPRRGPASSIWCRLEAVGAQDPGDGAARDTKAKVQQLPADALGAPARVLGGQPHDQGLHRVGNRWPTAWSGRTGPVSPHHAAVPPEQRLGRDHEERPSRPGEETAERRQQGAVVGPEPRPWVLAAQGRQLVTQDQDLNLVRIRRLPAEHQHLKDAAQRQVDERPDHQHLQPDGSTRGAP
jgi:hypothetical protein